MRTVLPGTCILVLQQKYERGPYKKPFNETPITQFDATATAKSYVNILAVAIVTRREDELPPPPKPPRGLKSSYW
jgi:hypothetical protein